MRYVEYLKSLRLLERFWNLTDNTTKVFAFWFGAALAQIVGGLLYFGYQLMITGALTILVPIGVGALLLHHDNYVKWKRGLEAAQAKEAELDALKIQWQKEREEKQNGCA